MLNRLSFGFSRKLPLILQTEAAECGLACIAMLAGYYGYSVDLASLRSRFPVSMKGSTLATLVGITNQLDLNSRPLKLELDSLSQLRLPCILHWNFNHFVVLKEVGSRFIVIHDPALGIRKYSWSQVSDAFTGVALELWPSPKFKPAVKKQELRLADLIGKISGIFQTIANILLLAIALEVFTLTLPFYLQLVIDNVLLTSDRDLLTILALGFGLLILMEQSIKVIRGWAIMYMNTTLSLQWHANVFNHLINLPVNFFEKRHLGDIISRFGSIENIQRTLTNSFLEAVLDGIMTLATLVLMLIYSPLLAYIAIAAMVLYALGRLIWYAPLRYATEEQIIYAAKQQSHFLETLRGIKTIKLFQRMEDRRTTWLSLLVDQINADLHTHKLSLLFQTCNGLIFGLENIIIIWLGAKLVMAGNFSVGLLIAFTAYKNQFDLRVAALIDKLVELTMLQLQCERLADIVLHQPESNYNCSFDEAQLESTSIEVNHLRYRYAEQEPYVLDDINFKIQAGESVAIVGPSGCGKTTLVNVMLGILPPTAGEIHIGNINVNLLGNAAVRNLVGTVLQDDVLFAGSIAENICFFNPQPDQDRIVECAKLAALHQDIISMPMGYNTLVGDMGTVLSGGQKQRLFLARAFYKRARILFLDEATSHLDVACEQIVNQSIKALNITRVIIAHRPETIAMASRVISLKNGKVDQATETPAVAAMPNAIYSEHAGS